MRLFLIAVFGAMGTLTRYGLQGIVQQRAGPGFPAGTLVVNVSGCLLLGFLGQLTLNRMVISPEMRIAMTIGFFGGYTTFSSFSWEAVKMFEDGNWIGGASYVLASVTIGLACTFLGVHAANRI
ncbi:MAG TPA: fluoride efflux transporter CrcB [Candidatus Binatia bacterium]|nr:fluoride efflux transporter CrcB [Candidatus Binatia bacterium]